MRQYAREQYTANGSEAIDGMFSVHIFNLICYRNIDWLTRLDGLEYSLTMERL